MFVLDWSILQSQDVRGQKPQRWCGAVDLLQAKHASVELKKKKRQ